MVYFINRDNSMGLTFMKVRNEMHTNFWIGAMQRLNFWEWDQ